MFIVSPKFCRMISIFFPVGAITFWPVIIFSKAPGEVVINHERIHLRQQLELLIVGFFLIYVAEFFYLKRIRKMSSYDAYKNIRFEREAYINERDKNYLRERKAYAWLKLAERK